MDKEKYYQIENQEWVDSLNYIIQNESPERVKDLIYRLKAAAMKHGIRFRMPGNTPYINTIAPSEES
ncbi:MAG: hypothetical protein KDC05_09575, partial [Bacteroidales bacterium]|nr:hypothetical protein [Bacteroidales bacterium]